MPRLLVILAALILTAFAIPSIASPLHSQTLFMADLSIAPVLDTLSGNPSHGDFRQCLLGSSLIVDFDLHPSDCLADGCSFQVPGRASGSQIPPVLATVASGGTVTGSTTTSFADFRILLDIDGMLGSDGISLTAHRTYTDAGLAVSASGSGRFDFSVMD